MGEGDDGVLIRDPNRLPEAGEAGADVVVVGMSLAIPIGVASGDIRHTGQAAVQ